MARARAKTSVPSEGTSSQRSPVNSKQSKTQRLGKQSSSKTTKRKSASKAGGKVQSLPPRTRIDQGHTTFKHMKQRSKASTTDGSDDSSDYSNLLVPQSESNQGSESETDDEEDKDNDSFNGNKDDNQMQTGKHKKAKHGVQHFSIPCPASKATPTTTRETDLTFLSPSATSKVISKISPNYRWLQIDHDMKQVTIDKTAVADFVVSSVFPKLKFITGAGIDLGYTEDRQSICSLILAGCHKVHSKEGMIWWETAKKKTASEIKRLRNDATKSMKSAFLGTCLYQIRIES
jgi:hypothetical protein